MNQGAAAKDARPDKRGLPHGRLARSKLLKTPSNPQSDLALGRLDFAETSMRFFSWFTLYPMKLFDSRVTPSDIFIGQNLITDYFSLWVGMWVGYK